MALASGCAVTGDDVDASVPGGSSPGAVVESFVEDLNLALQDKHLADATVQRSWAERLAGYFAPSERNDQRSALRQMLAGFVDTAQRPVVGSQISLAITYSRVELIASSENKALVRLVDGTLNIRWLNEQGEVLRERTGNITEIIGQTSGGLPVLRVNGLWFMTEG